MPLTLEQKKAHSARVKTIRYILKSQFGQQIKVQKSTGANPNPYVSAYLPREGTTIFDKEFARKCVDTIYGEGNGLSEYCGNVQPRTICMRLKNWEKLLTL